ncbi:MAG TPA: aldehyde dehydrogenase family protein [Trueperaceae bacterium]
MNAFGPYLGRQQRLSGPTAPVLDKYRLEPFAAVHLADDATVDEAVGRAAASFAAVSLTPPERYEVLSRAARLVRERHDDLVDTMVAETGFTLKDCASDVSRCVQTLVTSAEEAKRLEGEMVPLAGAPGQSHRLGFTLRVPLGVVCAITPFNSPLNTVAHKVAPAIAAGNTVVVKPSQYTPVSAAKLAEVLYDAGLPDGHLCVVFGSGEDVGSRLVADERIAFYAFTGSTQVGESIQRGAGLRRTQMELGSIASTIVMADADLELAATKVTAAAFRKAGQVCTSVQRLFVQDAVFDEVAGLLTARVRDLRVGDPRSPDTDVGPMISVREAERVEAWVRRAVDGGARLLTPLERRDAVVSPVVLSDVRPDMEIHCREVFGPVLALYPFGTLDEALAGVNDSPYGLSAGIFTSDIETAFRAARRIRTGVVQVNETSSSRVDLMPFGGTKASGHGKEGPRYAMREMSEERLVVLNLRADEEGPGS